ncbi:MAG: TRAP transporter small permease subunit [Myxococcales bacterium]|nr:TRAP transporter small permease subunit [Myxococcales bacterium]
MNETLRRIDRAWARGEGWLTVGVLILMVLVAGFQAFIRNLTRWDIQWANEMLTDIEWADSLLRKGTLWLAFLGASLATHKHKHIGIDILLRIAPARAKYTMLAISGVLAGAITLGLTYSFSSAVYLNLTERPIEYEMLGEGGSMHVCDASDKQVAALEDFDKPAYFCAFRSVLGALSVPAETPGAAFQLIVPLMFFAVSLRLFAQGIHAATVLSGGDTAIAAAEAEERRRLQAQQQSVRPPEPDGTASDDSEADSEAASDKEGGQS